MYKVCKRCEESKPIEAFGKNKTKPNGFNYWCKICAYEYDKEYRIKNSKKLQEYSKEYNKEYRIKNKEKIKEYYVNNRDKILKIASTWRKANSEKKKAYSKKWQQGNKDKVQHSNAMYRAARIERTPCWLTENDRALIQRKYTLAQKKTELTGEMWVVDHILPLQGNLVSGLHVPANLRVIKESTNLHKSNKFVPV